MESVIGIIPCKAATIIFFLKVFHSKFKKRKELILVPPNLRKMPLLTHKVPTLNPNNLGKISLRSIY